MFCSSASSYTEALIDDINTDKQVALKSLARPAYSALKSDPFLTLPTPNGLPPADKDHQPTPPGLVAKTVGKSKLGEEVVPASP
jgi:hypothetical protein